MPDVVTGVGTYADPSTVYCDLDELKSELGITDTDDDTKLTRAIAAASRQIDQYCGRRFWQDPDPVARRFRPDSAGVVYVDDISTSDDLIVAVDDSATGVYGTTLTVDSDFFLEPFNASSSIPVRPYEEIHIGDTSQAYFPSFRNASVQITARWGWPAVPDDICKATCLQAAQLFKSKDAVFGVAAFGEFGPLRVRSALNPIAEGLIAPYAKPAVG
jgi:hypothetical protein